MNVQEFLSNQAAEYYEQQAQNLRHNGSFVAQSWSSHGPPPTILDRPAHGGQVAQIARANVTGREVGQWHARRPVAPVVPANDPALLQQKADFFRQQATQQATRRTNSALKAALVDVRDAAASAASGKQVWRGPGGSTVVDTRQPAGPTPHLTEQAYHQTQCTPNPRPVAAYSIRDICRSSVGLDVD